jgi:hypothetical protein
MKASQGMVAALAMLIAAGASAREPDVRGMRVWSQPAYILFSHDAKVARDVVLEADRIERLLSKLLKREIRPTGLPVYIFIARGSVWSRYLQPSERIVGEFVPGRFASYLVLSTPDNGYSLRHAIYHEYTHLFLHTQYRSGYPLWFDEGMAEVIGATQFEGATATVGRPEHSISKAWLPMSRLLRIDKKSPAYLSDLTSAVHEQSWAMVHRGIVDNPEFGAQMFAYLKAVENDVPIDEAVQRSFGMTEGDLGRKIEAYTRQRMFRIGRIQLDQQEPIHVDDGKPVAEIDALEMLARAMFDTGFNPSRLGEVIAAATQRAPGAANVLVLQLRLAIRDRNHREFERLMREIEPQLADFKVARGVGLALFERVREVRPDDTLSAGQRLQIQQRALELLDAALRAQPHDPEAVWAFGMLAASTKQMLESALQRLLSASQSVAMNADIAMATALVYESMQLPEQMVSSFADMARFSRSLEQRQWARGRIDEAQSKGERK